MAFSLYEINSQIEQAWGAAVDPDRRDHQRGRIAGA